MSSQNLKISEQTETGIYGDFHSNPNLKFKQIIINNNKNSGDNDVFEVFKSMKNQETYLAYPNQNDNLDIIIIKNLQLLISLKGHKDDINIVKYFINNKNKSEYLISVDKSSTIIIWDINNDYSNIYQINRKVSRGYISGCLLCSLNLNNVIDNIIIFSYNIKDYTNIYSLDNKQKIKTIKETNEHNTYYILLWLNKKDNLYYLIELSNGNIYIYNIQDDTLYFNSDLDTFNYSQYNCGFVYTKNNNDFLFASNIPGEIFIWDLENKNIFSYINLNNSYNTNLIYLTYILQWSKKYIIACEYYNKGLKIIDIDKLKVIKVITSIRGKHYGRIICAKKFIHPNYGECLLTTAKGDGIILWTINNYSIFDL